MTSCDEHQTRIVALFDNEAGDDDLRLVAGHLQDCPACRAFYLDLVALRRAGMAAPVRSLSPGARQAVLDRIKTVECGLTARVASASAGQTCPQRSLRLSRVGAWVKKGSQTRNYAFGDPNPPYRWAAVLAIASLLITCFLLGRTAANLRLKLGAAEQRVTAICEQAKLAESQDRQQKALSALYFRMAELEERVNRVSPSQRASFATRVYDHAEKQSNL